jgi:tight adherence protein B
VDAVTALAWAALGAALLLVGAPAVLPSRVAALAGAGRLAMRAAGGPPQVSGPPWRAAAAAGIGVASVGVLLLGGVPIAIAAGSAGVCAWRLVRSAAVQRLASQRRTDLRTALGVLVAELDAGGRPAAALSAAADAAPAYYAVFAAAAQASGAAGDAAGVLVGDPDTAPLGHAWRLAEETGAALSAVLGRVADDVSAADAQRRAVRVALSGPRSSAVVLAGLPVLGLLLGVGMGAHPSQFLIGSPAGRWVCCAGVLLDVLGLAWLAAILRKADPP